MNLYNLINKEFEKDYFKNIKKKIIDLEKKYTIFPKQNSILNCLNQDVKNIKLVIIGQDPYPNTNATGFAFSTHSEKITKSLVNIFIELKRSFDNFKFPNHGSLRKWIFQGIILLNSILTVTKDTPLSHINIGWQIFTNEVVKIIDNYCNNIFFLLWGKIANEKKNIIKKNFFLSSAHPVNNNFIGNNHFIITNNFFLKKKIKINWNL